MITYEVRMRRKDSRNWEYVASYHPQYYFTAVSERRWLFFWKTSWVIANREEANKDAQSNAIWCAKHHTVLGRQAKVIKHTTEKGEPSRIVWFNGRYIEHGANSTTKART